MSKLATAESERVDLGSVFATLNLQGVALSSGQTSPAGNLLLLEARSLLQVVRSPATVFTFKLVEEAVIRAIHAQVNRGEQGHAG